MKNVTIKDIANHLCISVSTVSRALSDDKNIRKETKERIFKAAAELGYRRNPLAVNLRTGRSNTIGVIANEMISPFAALVFKGIQDVMLDAGVNVIMANSDNDSEQERRNLQIMESSMADGIIISLCEGSRNMDEFRRLQAKGIPMVFCAHTPSGFDASQVMVNDYDKAFYLMDHLICSGRRRIVHIKGPEDSVGHADIFRAYLDSLRKFGIEPDESLVIPARLSVEEGRRVADEILDSGIDFDAVFACGDLPAIGVMNRLRERGVRVPEDVSVAGFYGSPLSQMVYPALTTVEPPLYEMGQKAADLLLKRISYPDVKSERVVVDAKIRLRESTHK